MKNVKFFKISQLLFSNLRTLDVTLGGDSKCCEQSVSFDSSCALFMKGSIFALFTVLFVTAELLLLLLLQFVAGADAATDEQVSDVATVSGDDDCLLWLCCCVIVVVPLYAADETELQCLDDDELELCSVVDEEVDESRESISSGRRLP